MKNATMALRVVLFATILCLAASPLLALANLPAAGSVLTCDGGKPKEAELPGIGTFDIMSNGQIASRVGRDITSPTGEAAAELKIIGFTDSGSSPGVGSYTFSLDQRDAGTSWVQINEDGTLTQVMNFHLVAHVEALGNEPVYTTTPATVAADLETFPQTGAVYHLLEPIEFADARGKVRMRIHKAMVKMTKTTVY